MSFNAAVICTVAIVLFLGAIGFYLTKPSQKHSD